MTYTGLTGVVSILTAWAVCTVVAFVTLTHGKRVIERRELPISRGVSLSYDLAEIGLIFGVVCNFAYWGPEILGQSSRPSVAAVVAFGVGATAVVKTVLFYQGRRSQPTGH